MRIFINFVLMLLLTCCNNLNVLNPHGLSEKQLHADEITAKVMIQLKKEKELYPFGNTGRMLNQIKMLGLSFHYYKPIDIDKARELLTYSATLLLNAINESDVIRPYLENYPFKPENIEIRIFLLNPDGSKPALDELILVEMRRGKLEYLVRNLKTEMLMALYEETFEEASAKLHEKIAI